MERTAFAGLGSYFQNSHTGVLKDDALDLGSYSSQVNASSIAVRTSPIVLSSGSSSCSSPSISPASACNDAASSSTRRGPCDVSSAITASPSTNLSVKALDFVKFGGPSGIRTQDRRIKSQWLKLQDSTKNARKRTKTHETAGLSRKQQGQTQVSGHLSDTNMTNMTHMRSGNAGLRPKGHICANAVVAC